MTMQPSGNLSAASALVFKYNYSAACREKFKTFFEAYVAACDAKTRAQLPASEAHLTIQEGPLLAELFMHAPLCHKTEDVAAVLARIQSTFTKSIALFVLEEALTFNRAVRDAMLDDRNERFDKMRAEKLAEREAFRKRHENAMAFAREKGMREEDVVIEVTDANGREVTDSYTAALGIFREADRFFLQDFNGALLDHIHFLREQIDALRQEKETASKPTVIAPARA